MPARAAATSGCWIIIRSTGAQIDFDLAGVETILLAPA